MAGRPSLYQDEYTTQAEKLCKLGATDAELAEFFEVHEDTINEWKKVHQEFSVSIKRGKTLADANVADRLYQRAVGYSYDEITFEKIDNKINIEVTSAGEIKEDESYKKKVVTKELPPDVTAQIFWLKNRKKEKWRDKQEHEHSGEMTINWHEQLTDDPEPETK